MKFIDLFCGIGGFHQALANLGCQCVFASDIDENCRKTYKKNYGLEPKGDITKININDIPDFDILCGGFPCFIAGTKTLTNNGYKNIEDVEITDKLLTHTGKYQSILNLQRKIYTGDLYDFEIEYHPEIISATEEHPFYIREQTKIWNDTLQKYDYLYGEPKWKTASTLTMNDYFGMVINNKDILPEFMFDKNLKLDNSKYWFIIGYLVSNDKDDLINTNFGFNDFIWRNILQEFGNSTHDKIIPEWVQDAPIEFIQEFINGYNLTKTASIKFAYGLQRLYLKLGHVYSIWVNEQSIYTLLKIQSNVSAFIEDNYVWYAPLKIQKRATIHTNVYNFEVANDNSYVVENICVHNCQPFSKAGFQKGFDDDRGNLFFNICAIVDARKPKYILLENVRNLASHDDGNTWQVIRQSIDNLGYYTYDDPVLLNALHFNIPQNRERVVIMCKRKDLGELPALPLIDKNPKQNLTCFVGDIIDENAENTELTDKMQVVYEVWDAFIQILDANGLDIPKYPIWTDWWDNDFVETDEFYIKYKLWIDKNREFYKEHAAILQPLLHKSRQNKLWLGAVRKFEWQAGVNARLNKCLWTARGSGIRVKKCDYIPTLVAMSMIPIYGPKHRKLTPVELLRLQSFDNNFQYDEKHIFKQVGNAVNVKMIEGCARFLLFGDKLF